VTDYGTRLRNAYLDEVRGAAFFGALAEAQPDAKRREKLETLQTVEARTVTTMQRLLEQVGIRVDGNDARRAGREAAQAARAADWDALLATLRTSLPHDAAQYEALRGLSSRPDDPALRALVNHARAIERFLELEAAGDDSKSVRPLVDHLRKPA
jgi:hypothetical protein